MALRLAASAASAARMCLLSEAAALLQTTPDHLSVARGAISLDGRDTDLSWWRLVESCRLDEAVIEHAVPKPAAGRSFAGSPVPRTDQAEKMLGGGFIHDLVLEGMLHGRVLHPPSPRQRLRDLDGARIGALAGVAAVLRDGSFFAVLAAREDDAVRAIAVAERIARWSDPPDLDRDILAAVDAAAGPTETVFSHGTGTAGGTGTKGGTVLTAHTSRQPIAHAAIGPSCAIAAWRDDRLVVHSHTEGPHNLARTLAGIFAMQPEAVGRDPWSRGRLLRPQCGRRCGFRRGHPRPSCRWAARARSVEPR